MVAAVLVALWRLHSEQQQKRQQELELLANRCYRIVDLLHCLTDRYLPLTCKTVLVEYLISSIYLLERNKAARDLTDLLPIYVKLLAELKEGQQVSQNDKVQTHLQLTQVQAALQSIPLLLRGFVSNKVIDKATAKEQVEQVRFSYCLAHHDLLIREAEVSLEDDKKARALEKLRLALAEMEKVSSFTQSEPFIKRLDDNIKRVEHELFGKKA